MMDSINYDRMRAIREYCEEHDEDPTNIERMKQLIRKGRIA